MRDKNSGRGRNRVENANIGALLSRISYTLRN